MTIDQEIYDEVCKTIEKDPVKKANLLANGGDFKLIDGYVQRQQKAQSAKKRKLEDEYSFNQSETEACKNLLDSHFFIWWITNVLLPLTEMPDDPEAVTLSESIRRRQIEAKAYDKLLNMIYIAAKRKAD